MKEFDSSHRLVRFEGFQLDLRAVELHSDGGKTFRLPEQPFQILTMLLQRPGEVLTREDIRKKLWPNDTFVEYEHSISAAMNRLRQTLGDSADRPHYIETLARRGYRWMVSVEWVESSPPTSAVLDLPKSWKILVPTTVVIVALLIAGGLYFRSLRATPLTGKDTVVLDDFTNTTGDPVFDDTLKEALTVQLQQSPFLNILPEQTVDDTLKLMGRSPGQHLTREVARELCQRAGSRVMLAGSIASLGSQYVIGVNAVNCQTGNTLAQEQVTADSKEHVLKALGETTPELRKKLGETLSTIQKFDTSLEQATTSSLEALKAYTLSRETMNENSEVAAIPMMKHAIELDPNFALAYAKMGIMYSNIGEATLASQYSQKAYDLRERVSEREKFRITAYYYMVVTGELEKAVQTYELWAQNYPRDPFPPGSLGLLHSVMGQNEKSVAEELESSRLVPDNAINLGNLMLAYAALNLFDEAKATYQEATGLKLGHEGLHVCRYGLAMIEGDAAEMERQVVWGAGKRGVEDIFLSTQSDTEAFSGRLGKAREFSRRAVELAHHNQQNGTAAGWQTNQSLRERNSVISTSHGKMRPRLWRWPQTVSHKCLER